MPHEATAYSPPPEQVVFALFFFVLPNTSPVARLLESIVVVRSHDVSCPGLHDAPMELIAIEVFHQLRDTVLHALLVSPHIAGRIPKKNLLVDKRKRLLLDEF